VLFKRAQDHAISGFDRIPSHSNREDVNEVGVLGEKRGKSCAVGGVPRRFQ